MAGGITFTPAGLAFRSGGLQIGADCTGCGCDFYVQSRRCDDSSLSGLWLKWSDVPLSHIVSQAGTCYYFEIDDKGTPGTLHAGYAAAESCASDPDCGSPPPEVGCGCIPGGAFPSTVTVDTSRLVVCTAFQFSPWNWIDGSMPASLTLILRATAIITDPLDPCYNLPAIGYYSLATDADVHNLGLDVGLHFKVWNAGTSSYDIIHYLKADMQVRCMGFDYLNLNFVEPADSSAFVGGNIYSVSAAAPFPYPWAFTPQDSGANGAGNDACPANSNLTYTPTTTVTYNP